MKARAELLYADCDQYCGNGYVYDVLQGAARMFENLRELLPDERKEEMDRLMALAVILKPGATEPAPSSILAVGEIHETERRVPRPMPYELFVMKAASRAFDSARAGASLDMAPLSTLGLAEGELHRGCNARVMGVSVGVAGPFPDHSRLLAAQLALGVGVASGNFEEIDPLRVASDSSYLTTNGTVQQAAIALEGLGRSSGGDGSFHDHEETRAKFGWALDQVN